MQKQNNVIYKLLYFLRFHFLSGTGMHINICLYALLKSSYLTHELYLDLKFNHFSRYSTFPCLTYFAIIFSIS